MTLVQIVPRLPPAFDGVGGYAAALGRALARRGVPSSFLVAAGDGSPTQAHDDAPGSDDAHGSETVAEVIASPRNAAAFARQLAASGADTILAHYVNYGYQSRGCPSWLVEGLAEWRRAGGRGERRRLVTMFHEVYATGPPWRSSFWLSPLQRRLAARLLHASDGAATSLDLYAGMLRRWRPRARVVVAPVFSPIDPPEVLPSPEERQPRRMLLFGGAGNRRRAYGELRMALSAACRALDIAEIVDVGPAIEGLPAGLDGLPVRALGPQPATAVSALLTGSYAGFLAYPDPFLGKSTVFAAYCAHGLVPVCAWAGKRRGPAAALPPRWDPGAQPAPDDPAALAERARAWYAGHDLAHQAASFHALLCGAAPEEPRAA